MAPGPSLHVREDVYLGSDDLPQLTGGALKGSPFGHTSQAPLSCFPTRSCSWECPQEPNFSKNHPDIFDR